MSAGIAERSAEPIALAVVVSAMGRTTDRLVALARQVSTRPRGGALDVLLATGEQAAAAMLALALEDRGVPAVALTAWQCGIRTDRRFNRARIRSVDDRRLREELLRGRVVVVPGVQGVTGEGDLTTLGRGGGDITGAAVAAALEAAVYENYTDVNGVYSADPSLVDRARLVPALHFTHAAELASNGARVLHPRAVEICRDHRIPIHVRSSFEAGAGTWISGGPLGMEDAGVVGVSSDASVVAVLLEGVSARPGAAARIFRELAAADLTARLVVQGAGAGGSAHMTVLVAAEGRDEVPPILERLLRDGVVTHGEVSAGVATVTLVGSRLHADLGIAARMLHALEREGVAAGGISATDTTVSCVVAGGDRVRALRAVHAEFFDEPHRVHAGMDGVSGREEVERA